MADTALQRADSTTSSLLQRKALSNLAGIKVHEAKICDMHGNGGHKPDMVEGVVRLRGTVEDNFIFRGTVVLVDVLVLKCQWEEAAQLLSELHCSSNLGPHSPSPPRRASYWT